MHVLTKVFIVLVTLLAILLTPLVVVYAHNEDSFKSKYEDRQARISSVQSEATAAQARFGAETTRLEATIATLTSEKAAAERQASQLLAQVSGLESRLTAADAMKVQIEGSLSQLSETLKAAQAMNKDLLDDASSLRSDVMLAERRRSELDEQLREVQGLYDVEVFARQRLQEQMRELEDSLGEATVSLGMFEARFGALNEEDRATFAPVTVNIRTTVIGVERSTSQTMVEVAAGSVDGMQKDWVLSISRGGSFLGKVKITRVDLDSSVGILSLEDPENKGEVKIGDRAFANAGDR